MSAPAKKILSLSSLRLKCLLLPPSPPPPPPQLRWSQKVWQGKEDDDCCSIGSQRGATGEKHLSHKKGKIDGRGRGEGEGGMPKNTSSAFKATKKLFNKTSCGFQVMQH